jgi:hypothetical protein
MPRALSSAILDGISSTRKWPYEWINQVAELKVLGNTFSSETKTTIKNNWQRQFKIIQNILITNTHRHFTFYGRFIFIKQHVLSQLIHIAHVLPCNKTQALLLQQKCNKFLWVQRREHPPLNVLIRPRLQGGIGVTLRCQMSSYLPTTMFSLYNNYFFLSPPRCCIVNSHCRKPYVFLQLCLEMYLYLCNFPP